MKFSKREARRSMPALLITENVSSEQAKTPKLLLEEGDLLLNKSSNQLKVPSHFRRMTRKAA